MTLSDRFDKPYETRLEKFGYFLVGYAPNVRNNITMRVYLAPVGTWPTLSSSHFNVSEPALVAEVENPHTGERAGMAVKNRFTAPFAVRFLRGRIGALIA